MRISLWTITIIISTLIVFYSCEKKKQNIFQGTVTETITKNPLQGVNVTIEMKSIGSNGFISGYEVIGTAVTGDEGSFVLELEPAQAIKFRLSYSKNGYHFKTIEIEPEDVVGTYEVSTTLPCEAYLCYHFLNVAPNPNSDVFRYRITGMAEGCDICCNNDYHSFYGPNDTLILCPIIAYDTLNVEFYTFLNGVSHQYYEEIIGQASDTVYKTIRY